MNYRLKILRPLFIVSLLTLHAGLAQAGDDTVDAALGGALGGAVGAAIGNEVGGREGAIIGGAAGGALGAAAVTDDGRDRERRGHRRFRKAGRNDKSCPPGLAMQNRCHWH